MLKEMILVIRPERARETEAFLLDEDCEYVSRLSVTGRGKEMGTQSVKTWLGTKHHHSAYLHKTMISVILSQDKIPPLVKKIIKINQTKSFGDGKIFILPIGETP